MEKTAKGLAQYAIEQIGKPYWYGTFGQTGSRELYEQKKRQYPGQYGWDYRGETEAVHDCVGLIKGYLWCKDGAKSAPVYDAAQDLSANAMRAACKIKGNMDTMPDVPGVLVFKDHHVGVYVGNGEVVEARSRRYGVVKGKLADRPWSSWGYCPFVTYETIRKTVNVSLPVLKRGMKNESVRAMQNLLLGYGFSMGGYGADGSFGGATERALKSYQQAKGLSADGSCGGVTWGKLLGIN